MRASRFCIPCFAVLGLLVWSGCERTITDSAGDNVIRLNFKEVAQPSRPSLFSPQGIGRLAKTSRMVTDQVVLLHCDEETGNAVLDASQYGNNANLNNVRRVDSSATATLKKALDFQRVNSYVTLPTQNELNGTHGFTIQFYFYIKEPFLTTEQCLLDRNDASGGYTIGILRNKLYVRVKQTGKVTQVDGNTTLTTKRWYKLEAYFSSGKLGLKIDDKLDREIDFTGPITTSTRQTLLGAGWADYYITNQFWGRMDEISISTTVEYEDFDAIHVMVFDISEFTSIDSFYTSATWRNYQTSLHTLYEGTTKMPTTWDGWKQVLSPYFKVASETVLSVKGGFAVGTARGVDGLNMIAIGCFKNNEVTYYGSGFALVVHGHQESEAVIEIWKAGVN
jgi:hypothetical protein